MAGAVADDRAGVEQRLQLAVIGRAETEARAAEQRKRRNGQFARIAAVVLLVAAGGGFAWWDQRRDADQARIDEGGADHLRPRLARCRADFAMLRELDAIDNARWTVTVGKVPRGSRLPGGSPGRSLSTDSHPGPTLPVTRLNESAARGYGTAYPSHLKPGQ